MAETKRMTAEQVVGYLLEGEGLDFLRESLSWVVQQLMEAEVSEVVGAGRGERAPDERLTHRNGYRARSWSTRAGELELAIPKLRRGSYFPSFLEPRKRSEQVLVSVVQEAYVAGVSTRKVDQVVESLGLRISKSEVSRICQGLDEQVDAFRNRPLEGRYPYLWLDAKVEKVRDGGRVVRKALVLAYGVHESGSRSRRACGAQLHEALLARLQAAGEIDWSRAIIDASYVQAKKGGCRARPLPRRSRPSGCQAPCPGRRPRSPARLVGDACEPQRCHAVAPPRRCVSARARSYRSSAPAANAADRRPWLRP